MAGRSGTKSPDCIVQSDNLLNCKYMKKFVHDHYPEGKWKKTLFLMKLSIVIMFCSLGSMMAAPVFSQQAKLDVSYRQQPLGQVLSDLRDRSGFDLIFFEGMVPENTPVTIVKNGATIAEILDEILPAYGLGYTINENIVTIKRATAAIQQPSSRTVTGQVTDPSGVPMIGVTVSIKGTVQGASTGADGRFMLSVPAGSTLVFSYIGMETQEVVVGDQTTISIRMAEDAVNVEQVVVTGVFNRPKESYTGAAVTLSGTQLLEASTGNLVTAIRNLDPTFYVAENNLLGSDPNALPIVTMRGNTTLPMIGSDATSSQAISDARTYMERTNLPLLVVNDVETSFERLIDIDEYMVESITLLKDANATAVYGARGSNGVLVIRTKRPKPGQLMVSYRGTFDLEAPDLSSYNLMNAREKLAYERAAGLYSSGGGAGSVATQQRLEQLYQLKKMDVDRGVDTYWLKYPVRVPVGHRHSLSIEGGHDNAVERFTYKANVSYKNDPGAMKGSSRSTFNGGIMFEYRYKNLLLRNDLQVYNTVAKDSPYGNFSNFTKINSYYRPFDENGMVIRDLVDQYDWPNDSRGNPWRGDTSINPLYDAMQPQKHTSSVLDIVNDLSLEWKIADNFTARGTLSVSTSRDRSDDYWSPGMSRFDNLSADDRGYAGEYQLDMGQKLFMEGRVIVEYLKTFKDVHQVIIGAGGTMSQSNTEAYDFTGYGVYNPDMDFFGGANFFDKNSTSHGKPYGTDELYRRVGALVSLVYTYDQRYTFNFDGKYDGSSQFGENNRFAPIWSLGFGWNLHREKFFRSAAVDEARFRLSYGLSGSQGFPPYISQVMFNDVDRLYEIWGGLDIQGVGNPNLKWQNTYEWNVGTDWSFYNRRFYFSVDLYRKKTHDLITDVNLPPSSGFGSYSANIGKIENKGIEFMINGQIIRDTERGIFWSVGATAGHNKNTILEVSESLQRMNELIEGQIEYSPGKKYIEGTSINTIYAANSLGIDPATGREIFLTRDGKQTFSWTDAEKVACGVTDPDLQGTVNTSFRWKGWHLNAFFHYSWGSVDYNSVLSAKVETRDIYGNADRRALHGRWQKVGQQAPFVSIGAWRGDSGISLPTKATSRFVMDNNYFTLSSLNIGYDVPVAWSKRVLGAEYVQIATTFGELFHISTIKRERGINYPFARVYQLSITARF